MEESVRICHFEGAAFIVVSNDWSGSWTFFHMNASTSSHFRTCWSHTEFRRVIFADSFTNLSDDILAQWKIKGSITLSTNIITTKAKALVLRSAGT